MVQKIAILFVFLGGGRFRQFTSVYLHHAPEGREGIKTTMLLS